MEQIIDLVEEFSLIKDVSLSDPIPLPLSISLLLFLPSSVYLSQLH